MSIPSYIKIHTLGKKEVTDIYLRGRVQVEEKVDGSFFGFGNLEGTLHCRSKSKQIMIEAPDDMFKKAVATAVRLMEEGKLPRNVVFYGEYLQKPKHSIIKYDRVPKGNIILFDAFSYSPSGKELLEPLSLDFFSERLGLEMVPALGQLPHVTAPAIDGFLRRDSILGGGQIEGVVIKSPGEWYSKAMNQSFPLFPVKKVNDSFKEVHEKDWKKEHTGKGKIEALIEMYCTEARWLKAVHTLRDAGELTETPKDIGKLMLRVRQDVVEEDKAEIMEKLWEIVRPDLLRAVGKGLPEW